MPFIEIDDQASLRCNLVIPNSQSEGNTGEASAGDLSGRSPEMQEVEC
jgi:hypothetical protein